MTHFEITLVTHGLNRTILREKALSLQITGVVRGGAKSYDHEVDGIYYFLFYPKLYADQGSSTPLITFPLVYLERSNPFIPKDQTLVFYITITLPATFDNYNNTDYYWLGITGSNSVNPSSGRMGPWYAKPQIILRNRNTGADISVSRSTVYNNSYTIPEIPSYKGYVNPLAWSNTYTSDFYYAGDSLTINHSLFANHNDPFILEVNYTALIDYAIMGQNYNGNSTATLYNYNIAYSIQHFQFSRNVAAGYEVLGNPTWSRIIGMDYGGGDPSIFYVVGNTWAISIPSQSYGDIVIDYKTALINYNIYYIGVISNHSNRTTRTIKTPTINLTEPSARNGYTFDGWYTEVTYINEVTEITIGSIGDITLYAKWNLIEYDIVLDKDGGNITQVDSTYNIEDDRIQIFTGLVGKVGYRPDGFEIISGPDSGSPYIDGAFLYINSSYGNIEIKAKWNIRDYYINYVGNTTGLTFNKTSFDIEELHDNDYSIILDKPLRDGYLIEYDTDIINSPGDIDINITQTPFNLSIIFNDNQASVVSDIEGSMTNQVVPYNDSFNLKSNNFTAPGYLFTGWLKDNEGVLISNQADRTPLSYDVLLNTGDVNVELYAQWNMITYDIIYIGNTTGLTFNKTSFDIVELDEESYDIELDIPTRTGYTVGFDETVISDIGNKIIMVTQEVDVYTITFDSQDGSDIDDIQYNIEQSVNLTNIIPVRDGYTFNGWFTSASGGTKVTSYPVGTNGNKDLYAQWSINSYNIVFRNKYDSADVILKTYAVEYNSTISAELFDGVIPSRPNIGNIIFTFIGWNTNSNETTPLSDLGIVPVVGKTFYAIYSYKIKGLRKGSSNVAFALGDTLLNNVALADDIIWEKDDE